MYALLLEVTPGSQQVERKGVGLVPVQLAGKEPVQTCAAQELGYAGREAERVREPGDLAAHAELLLEVPLPVKQLAHERLAAGDLAIRFRPRTSYGFPASL